MCQCGFGDTDEVCGTVFGGLCGNGEREFGEREGFEDFGEINGVGIYFLYFAFENEQSLKMKEKQSKDKIRDKKKSLIEEERKCMIEEAIEADFIKYDKVFKQLAK